MITWITGWPHNGSTLIRQILKDCFDIKTYSLYPEPQFEYLFGPEVVTFSKGWAENPIVRLEHYRSLPEMYFIKTHELPIDDSPALYVIRDGRDCVTAASHFWAAPIRFTIAGVAGRFGGWTEHFYAWDPANRKNTQLVRFEDMVLSPDQVAARLGKFIGKEPLRPYVDNFEKDREKWPQLFHDRIGCWKQRMSQDDIAYFFKCHGELMRELDYE